MIINFCNQLYVYGKYFISYVLIVCYNKEIDEFVIDHVQEQL